MMIFIECLVLCAVFTVMVYIMSRNPIATFGGIDIFVPEDVNIKIKSTPIFGGVSNKAKYNKESDKTIYIDAFCMFGGIDIK